MAVGKKELVATIAEQMETTKKAAGLALEGVIEAVKTHLAEGEDVSIVGLVGFTQKVVPAHERVLGFSGETVQVPERVQIRAKASKTLTK